MLAYDCIQGPVGGTLDVVGLQEGNDMNDIEDNDANHGDVHDPDTAFEDIRGSSTSSTQERDRKVRYFKLKASWDFMSKVAVVSWYATTYALQLLEEATRKLEEKCKDTVTSSVEDKLKSHRTSHVADGISTSSRKNAERRDHEDAHPCEEDRKCKTCEKIFNSSDIRTRHQRRDQCYHCHLFTMPERPMSMNDFNQMFSADNYS